MSVRGGVAGPARAGVPQPARQPVRYPGVSDSACHLPRTFCSGAAPAGSAVCRLIPSPGVTDDHAASALHPSPAAPARHPGRASRARARRRGAAGPEPARAAGPRSRRGLAAGGGAQALRPQRPSHSPKQLHQLARAIRSSASPRRSWWPRTGPSSPATPAGRRRGCWAWRGADAAALRPLPAQRRAYAIADNRLAEHAGWDREALALELGRAGRARLRGRARRLRDRRDGPPRSARAADGPRTMRPTYRQPAARSRPRRVAPGDLWQLGDHRLLCADALDPACHERLLGARAGADGLHRPALQRAHRRPRRRPRRGPPPRLRHGRGRDGPAEFTRFLRRAFGAALPVQRARLDPLRLHGLAPQPRAAGRGAGPVLRRLATSASGPRTTAAWARSTAPSTSWSACSRTAPGGRSTTSSSAPRAATGPTSGTTRA